MKGEYIALKGMSHSDGYKVLQALWVAQGNKLMDSINKAAARGQESAWRWYAGQLKGFDVAITQLDRALQEMEKEENNEAEQKTADQLLMEIKGEIS